MLNIHGEFCGLQNSRLAVAFKIKVILICFTESRFGLGGESAGDLVQWILLHFESRPGTGAGIAARAIRGALQGECFAKEWAESWHASGDDDNILFNTTTGRISEQEMIKDISSR